MSKKHIFRLLATVAAIDIGQPVKSERVLTEAVQVNPNNSYAFLDLGAGVEANGPLRGARTADEARRRWARRHGLKTKLYRIWNRRRASWMPTFAGMTRMPVGSVTAESWSRLKCSFAVEDNRQCD